MKALAEYSSHIFFIYYLCLQPPLDGIYFFLMKEVQTFKITGARQLVEIKRGMVDIKVKLYYLNSNIEIAVRNPCNVKL